LSRAHRRADKDHRREHDPPVHGRSIAGAADPASRRSQPDALASMR
jgi:hypothetical protein